MDLTPAHFSPAPAHSTPGTVDGLQPTNPGTQTVAVPWGGIVGNLSNQTDLVNALAAKANTADLNAHVTDTDNPHVVTKDQIGLGNVDNTSDMDKPVSIATAAAIAGVSIPAGQITDASALGRALLTNATADEDLDDLGAGANGKALFAGATAADNRTNLGSTAVGDALFTAADAAAARTAIGATATGSALVTAADAAAARAAIGLPLMPFGQCYFTLSGGLLTLNRQDGKYLFIDGAFREIPSGGVTLAATGATVGTTYNIYAFWTGSAIALEFSATARATDATYGHQIKNGDATRTLVGKAYTTTGPAWVNSATTAGVLSWFNRKHRSCSAGTGANIGVTAVAPTELSTAARSFFLSWGEESVVSIAANNLSQSTNGVVTFGSASIGGPSGIASGPATYFQAPSAGAFGSVCATHTALPAENLGSGAIPASLCYFSQNVWLNAAGTATVNSGATNQGIFIG